jgi:hypothetical protein
LGLRSFSLPYRDFWLVIRCFENGNSSIFGQNKIGRHAFTVRIVRISGAILSFLTLALIVQWTINLYERDIEDLPIILALQDEIRIKPEDQGGEKVAFKGLSVNSVLDEGDLDSSDMSINLAPVDEQLLENESSPIILPKEGEESDITASITSALESLLGISEQTETTSDENIELHIASYSTADEANAHWFLLQQVNFDLLVNYNHQVVKISNPEKQIYRLRIVGFESIAAAQDMCARLIERGEKCVPTVGNP